MEGYNVAYVGNIAFEAGEEDLRELMGDCTIMKVRLHTDRETGRFKGYAHVHFADEESLDRQAFITSLFSLQLWCYVQSCHAALLWLMLG